MRELARRSAGVRESGAFLLGRVWKTHREFRQAVYYDDLAPNALARGDIVLPGSAFGALWQICRKRKLQVVADVHTHPGSAHQSAVDRTHPMIAEVGHLALILPRYATPPMRDALLGLYEYEGRGHWRDHSGPQVGRLFLRTPL